MHTLSILVKADKAIATRIFTSFVDLPESGMLPPKYLNGLICSNCFPDSLTGVVNVSDVFPTETKWNHGKLGILTYHEDLVLQWLKESKQFLCT